MFDADLIVVGAGSGGAVFAARCAAHMRVLLVEVGDVPSTTPPEIAGPNFHRAYALPGRRWTSGYESGRGLGGSSAVNAMVADGPVDGLPIDGAVAEAHERGPVSEALLRLGPSVGLDTRPLVLTRSSSGARCSVVEAYVEPMRSSGRLEVLGDALVDRVVIDGGVVGGVRLADGRVFTAPLVAVAAGAVRTPAVLVRSGVARRGVGRGLQDHPTVTMPLSLRVPLSADELGRLVSVSVGGFATWRVPGDVQVIAADAIDERSAALLVSLLHVESRGAVRVVSDDPWCEPEVDAALLAEATDADGVTHALAIVERLLVADEFRGVAEWTGERVVGGAFHASSTCRIGPADDDDAVVDDVGRVHGVEGLIVCDASVFPAVPMANPHLAVVRFAEHAAAAVCRGRNCS